LLSSARLALVLEMPPAETGASGTGGVAAPRAVLVYSHSWLPGQVDGVAVRIMAHTKELVKRGTKVIVVTPDFVLPGEGKTEVPPMQVIPGVEEHVTVDTQLTPVYRKNMCMKFSLKNLLTLISVIKRLKPDYVHGTQEASMQVLATACLLCDVPLVVSMHTDVGQIAARDQGFSSWGGMLGRLHTKIAVMCTHWGYRNWTLAAIKYFCVSKQAQQLLKGAGVLDRCVVPHTWGPMVDRETFRINLPEDKVKAERERLTFGIPNAFLMIYVGRVTAEKDIQFVVDALDRAPKNVVFGIIGNGSMVPDLKKLHGKERRIHCTGDILNREQVATALRAADACVSASTMETVGFTAMESLSCGTPCLMANAQGFKEHLSHGTNARLWTPHDPASFDRELAAIMEAGREGNWAPEALRESMAWADLNTCTDRALQAYSYANHANRRMLRLLPTLGYFWLNWLVTNFIMG